MEVLQPALRQLPEDSSLMTLAGELYMQTTIFRPPPATSTWRQGAIRKARPCAPSWDKAVSRWAKRNARSPIWSRRCVDKTDYQADVALVMSYLKQSTTTGR